MKPIKTLIFLIIVGAAGLIVYAYSGMYSVAVGTGHNAVTRWYLSTLRERSIEVRAGSLSVPADLDNEERVLAGAGHYSQMCAGCHGRPGREPTDHFDPVPPALYHHAEEPAEAFWIVKNGIKMSAMSQHQDHSDEDLWSIVAFLQRLPQLSEDDYTAITAKADDQHDEGDHGAPAQALPADPIAALDAFHQALKDGNGDAALALLHDKATILEEGRIETRQEYAGQHLVADMEFMARTEAEQVSRENKVQGRQATVTTRSHTTGGYNNTPVDVTTDESASLYRTENGWIITHIQWSSVTDEDAATTAPAE